MSLTLRFSHDELLSIINKAIDEARADDADCRASRRRGRGRGVTVLVEVEGDSPRVHRLVMIRDHLVKSDSHDITILDFDEIVGFGEY